MTRDQSNIEQAESTPSQVDIKNVQKVVGELLRLVTSTRPDLMYTVARMGSNILKNPMAVAEAGIQAKSYLIATKGQGIKYMTPMKLTSWCSMSSRTPPVRPVPRSHTAVASSRSVRILFFGGAVDSRRPHCPQPKLNSMNWLKEWSLENPWELSSMILAVFPDWRGQTASLVCQS